MSFLRRIAKGFGIGRTTITLSSPTTVQGDAGQLTCHVVLTAGSPQLVNSVTATVSRVLSYELRFAEYLSGQKDVIEVWGPQTDTTELAKGSTSEPITLGEKEARTVSLTLGLPRLTADVLVATLPEYDFAQAQQEFQRAIEQSPDQLHSAIIDQRGGTVSFQLTVLADLEDAPNASARKALTIMPVAPAPLPDLPPGTPPPPGAPQPPG